MVLESSPVRSPLVIRETVLRAEVQPAKYQFTRPILPTEILERIVGECLDTERLFASVTAMSVASRLLRSVVKRVFFHDTRMLTVCSAHNICRIPDIAPWIRHLSINNPAFNQVICPASTLPLHSLNLVSLEIYLGGSPISSSLNEALPSSLRLLRVVSLAHINPASLSIIAQRCKGIEELELSVTDALDQSGCLDCFSESESRVVHSPVGHGKRAQTREQVIDAYANALQLLTRLRRLALGVFISPAAVIARHLSRHRVDAQPYTTEGTPAHDTASAQNTPAVARDPRVKMSDCRLVQAPPATNITDHVARFGRFATPSKCMDCVREHSEIVRRDELRATVHLVQRLRSLESVWWSSWFSGDDRTDAMWTKLSAVREGTRLKVVRQGRL